jgi:hypothetical protein
MRLARNQSLSVWLISALVAVMSLGAAAEARGEALGVAASCGVSIVEPVGAAVAFNTDTQVLSAIFLSGWVSEKISLVRSGREGNAASASAANRPDDAVLDSSVVFASATVSVNKGSFVEKSSNGDRFLDDRTVVVIAHFN